ncbi:MAG: sulfotransferase family 2 domain-containing protein [Marinibacterium sp.]
MHINKCGGTSIEKALGWPKIHFRAQKFISILGRARWDALHSFAVVRHPYARVVSLYTYRVKRGHLDLDTKGIGLNDWVFETFVRKNPEYVDRPRMFAPCVDWVTDRSGKMAVKQILKLETLDADWPGLCRAIGSDAVLPHHNASGSTEVDLHSDAMDALKSHFDADFTAFGYDRTGMPPRS